MELLRCLAGRIAVAFLLVSSLPGPLYPCSCPATCAFGIAAVEGQETQGKDDGFAPADGACGDVGPWIDVRMPSTPCASCSLVLATRRGPGAARAYAVLTRIALGKTPPAKMPGSYRRRITAGRAPTIPSRRLAMSQAGLFALPEATQVPGDE